MQGSKTRHTFKFSIHALREERDAAPFRKGAFRSFSIHALREERDTITGFYYDRTWYFSIHALREERDFRPAYPGGSA